MTRIGSPAPVSIHENGKPDETDSPHLLAMQPRPADTNLSRAHNAAGHFTAITRDWRDMDDVARCGLCHVADCQARRTGRPSCLVSVAAFINVADTQMFSRIDWDAAHAPGLVAGLGVAGHAAAARHR